MKISESIIDTIIVRLDQEEDYDVQLAEKFAKVFEDYLVYLEKEIFPILSSYEADLLLFSHQVLLEAISQYKGALKVFELHEFFDVEEKLWEHFEDNIKVAFRERITPVFEKSKEEDALAFVEDLIIAPEEEEEDHKISDSGRDVIWNVSAAFIQLITTD